MLGLAGGAVLLTGAAVLAWRASRPDPAPTPPPPVYAGWRAVSPALSPHRESASAVIDGRLYVFGGHYNQRVQTSSMVQVYDPKTGTWSQRAPLPAPTTHWNAVSDGETVWLAGGFVGDHPGPTTADVWRYEVAGERWHRGPPLPAPRGGGALFLIGGSLHYVGGFLPDRRTNSADHWRLPLKGDSIWTPRAPLPHPRGQLSGVVLDGAFYAIGGQFGHDGGSHDLPLVHRYDPTTDRWTDVAPLPRPVSHAEPSTFAVDGRAMVIGGRDHTQPWKPEGYWLESIMLFDPARDLWITLDDLPKPLTGPAAAVLGPDLIVSAGGTGPGEVPVTDTWLLPFHDAWRQRPPLPEALGEVAAGVIGRHLYVVGEAASHTMRYDLTRATWSEPGTVAPRPFAGDHHAAEVVGERLYLLGGFGAEGRTQIYDPRVDGWRLGAPMPFAAGSSVSAVIGGRIYLAGGIVGDSTTPEAAVYDPTRDTWRRIAPMPAGRNHAASATDGRRLFVFGGRGKGSGDRNVVANGFADVQIYDPATDRWSTSEDPRSGIAPLPQARGGTGKAVYLAGRFYVLGGETRNGPGANAERVYARVDIYDPRRNEWRRGRDMPVPRHGIFPVEVAGRIFVAGGGTRAGRARSAAFDYYTPPAAADPRSGIVTAGATRTPAARRPARGSPQ
ncbi:MAG: Kelch repeat-containing protein [Gemmatimonadales bacterium]